MFGTSLQVVHWVLFYGSTVLARSVFSNLMTNGSVWRGTRYVAKSHDYVEALRMSVPRQCGQYPIHPLHVRIH